MSLQQLILILRARVLVLLLAPVLGVAAAIGVSAIMERQYTAVATVVVDSKANDTITGALVPAPLMPTQIEILRSHRVALGVVDAIKLPESPVAQRVFAEKADGRGSIRDFWAGRLLLGTEIQARRESNLVDIKFTASEPRFAAVVANAFAKSYLDVMLDLTLEPSRQVASFFDEQIKSLREGVEKAQLRLSEYQRGSGIVSSNDKLDVEQSRLEELYSQHALVLGEARDSDTRQKSVADFASRGANPDGIPDVLGSSLILSLKADIAKSESKYKEVSATLGANHPQLLRQASEINALRQKLEQEIQFAVGNMTTLNAMNTQREVQLRKAIADQKSKMLQLKRQQDEITVLNGEVDSAQKAYDAALQRYTQSTLASRASQTNVAVLSPAVEPVEPSSPRIFRNILVGLIGGLVLGLNLALAIEMLNRRVRSASDSDTELSLPVLGVLEGRSERLGAGVTERLGLRWSRARRWLPGQG